MTKKTSATEKAFQSIKKVWAGAKRRNFFRYSLLKRRTKK